MTSLPANRKIITFDLDNTLWPTSKVITAANAALTAHLKSALPPQNSPDLQQVWEIMGDIYSRDSSPYRSADDPEGDNPPVQLTSLRKAAIRRLCRAGGMTNTSEINTFTNDAFQIWADARHRTCTELLTPNTVESITRLRANGALIGALTNGNADVYAIEPLKNLFDFAVLSEDVGVAKPNQLMFEAALEKASSLGGSKEGMVHVGDDITCDVLPALKFGVNAVFVTSLISEEKLEDGKKAIALQDHHVPIINSLAEMKI